jgi:preprotein translocase subunit SecY
MLSAFTNSLKIPELRQKIFFTLALLFIARVGANIPLPGMNVGPIRDFFADEASAGGGLVGMFNMFTGGALLNGAVFALGIMPYISASIIMQLVGAVFPSIARLQQEGDVGRQKINQYTRYLTLGICVIQGLLLLVALSTNPASLIGQGFSPAEYGQIVIAAQLPFLITGTVFLTAGTMIMVWLGEQITQKGIGNGISLLITISIISGLPGRGCCGLPNVCRPRRFGRCLTRCAGRCANAGAPFRRDCCTGCHYSGSAQDSGSICEAGSRAQSLRRPELLPSAQSELRRGDASYLR